MEARAVRKPSTKKIVQAYFSNAFVVLAPAMILLVYLYPSAGGNGFGQRKRAGTRTLPATVGLPLVHCPSRRVAPHANRLSPSRSEKQAFCSAPPFVRYACLGENWRNRRLRSRVSLARCD